MKFTLAAACTAIIAAISSVNAHSSDSKKHGVSVHVSNNNHGNGTFWVKDEAIDLRASWRGAYAFNDEGDGVEFIDGRFEIENGGGPDVERVIFRGDGDSFRTIYSINDQTLENNTDTAARVTKLVRFFVLESGIHANERVEMLFERGGADAVFDEIGLMTAGHAKKKYLSALAATTQLSANATKQYAEIVSDLDSGHAIRKSIAAFFEHQNSISPATRDQLLAAANNIEGDHDIRKVIETVAQIELTPTSKATVLDLMQRIEGDHDFRKAAEVIFNNDAISADDATPVLELAAKQLEGDHDKRKVVEAATALAGNSDKAAAATLLVADKIESDHARRKALQSIATALPSGSAHWLDLLTAAAAIDSDHEKRRALQVIAEHMPAGSALTKKYRAIANSIESEHERDKALAHIQ